MNLRGHKRQEFSQKVRKATFVRACQQAPENVENVPGVPQCEGCGNIVRAGSFIYEHDQADGLGGTPTAGNCKLHCYVCKKTKDDTDNAIMRKADRVLKKTFGLAPSKRKIQSRGFERRPPQFTASRPIRKGISE